jgi:hypothetical protein
MVFYPGVGYFIRLAESDNSPQNQPTIAPNRGDLKMRRLLLVAAAASIALVGLSANQCGGGDQQQTEQKPEPTPTPAPEAAPENPAPPEQPQ